MKKKLPKILLKLLLKDPFYPWETFHEKTKWKKLLPPLDITKWPENWKTTIFKEYPRLDNIILPSAEDFAHPLLKDALLNRKSNRNFSDENITLEQLSTLLYYSAGLRENKPPWIGNRAYPSADGRYAIEVYVISLQSDLPIGIYHYNLRQHSLEVILPLEIFEYDAYFPQDWIKSASCVILFTAIFDRNTIKYGARGYRHILQEAGHLGQNFYLNAAALDIAICAIDGYADDSINNLLDVDGVKETIIYALAVGNK